jgi:hypothetical protein
MLEFGLTTDSMAKRLLKNEEHEAIADHHVVSVLLLMKKYGLAIPVLYNRPTSNGSDVQDELVYLVPSLFPEDPDSIIPSRNNSVEQNIVTRLKRKFALLYEFESSQTAFLAFFLHWKEI